MNTNDENKSEELNQTEKVDSNESVNEVQVANTETINENNAEDSMPTGEVENTKKNELNEEKNSQDNNNGVEKKASIQEDVTVQNNLEANADNTGNSNEVSLENANINTNVEEVSKNVESQAVASENVKENKPADNTENKPVEKKDSAKPEYAKEMMKKRKRRTVTILLVLFIVLAVTALSTVFALLNTNNPNIAQGVYVKNIDISGLSVDEATEKLRKAIEIELQSVVKMEYNEYSTEIEPQAFDYTYNIEEAVNEAYKVGRDGNLIQNNYAILFSMFIKNNIELKESYNQNVLAKTIEDVAVKIPGVVENPSYYVESEDNKLIIVKGKDGIAVKKDELEKAIINNIKERSSEKLVAGEKVKSIVIPVENKKAEKIDIEKIHNEVKKDPEDAYLIQDPFELHPEVNGTDFDISIEEAKKIVSEDKEEYEIPLKEIKASYTVYDIGLEAFPYVLSEFSTRYDATNYNRSTNLELACEKINGTILMPGEVFSYNQVVGKRTIEAGFRSAAIYSNGKVEDGLGGGICQVSSTLYNAALLANLEIVERDNHMFKTSYINAGRDATVVYGSIDFKFENSRKYPIRIEAESSGGICEMSIHGIKEDVEYEVEIIPEITSSIPYSVETIEDDSLAPGQTVVESGGAPGYRVTTYKELWLDGELVSSEVISNDTYRAMNRVVKVGPSSGGSSSDDSGSAEESEPAEE